MGICAQSQRKMSRQDHYEYQQPQQAKLQVHYQGPQQMAIGRMEEDVNSRVQDNRQMMGLERMAQGMGSNDQDKEKDIFSIPSKQRNSIQQQQKAVLGSQILISDVCKKCKKHIREGQKVTIKPCKHLYDINCFTDHFKEHKTCCTKDKIIINQAKYPKVQVNEIMKYKLKQLIANIKTFIVVQCPTQFCSFLFIYQKECNKNQKKKFYCPRCQQEMVYDGKMCKFIDQQTVQNDNNVSDTQIFLKLKTVDIGCSVQEHWRITDVLVMLSCNHQWCKKCLFVYYKDCLAAVCHCGNRYSKKIFDQINYDEEWNDIYDRQLQIIMQESKLSWQFCKNNCGFFFECKNMHEDSYCIKCDQIKTCNKCKKEVQSQHIQVNQCNHYYHLLCSYDLVEQNNLKNLSCLCGQKLDSDVKIEMNITCIICQRYDDNLIMFQCSHFIHQECLQNNLQAFSSFKCIVCLIPIDNMIYEPKLLSIRDTLIQMKQYSNQNYVVKSNIVQQNKEQVNLVGNQQIQTYQVIISKNNGQK
ncbi:unnamed protein product [Paramecium octaurelia]|uniref:RING-type domain-containing protein n=1 Tax=Paramecium octaurelia TaxID=43137 RepID=A0A8S1XY46_PAROT|nr:unnamed protein product [Paramecium octaurelia]